MRTSWGYEAGECRFDVPPRFGVAERRLAELAVTSWIAGGRVRVQGFEQNSLVIAHCDGVPVIVACPNAVMSVFGVASGLALTARNGIVAELVAACDLIALRPEPALFEASLSVAEQGLLLARGVALPLFHGTQETGEIQIVLSWREVLNRTATTRLKREIGFALRHSEPFSARSDPFSSNSNG